MRIRDFLLPLLIVILVVGCSTTRTSRPAAASPEKAWVGQPVAYHKLVSATHGIIGYVKTYEYSQESYGGTFRLYRISDLDFRERGFLRENGTGTKFIFLSSTTSEVLGTPVAEEELGAQPFEYNAGLILDVTGEIQMAPATKADLKR